MTASARTYTPAEAAAISGIGVKAVHNAIDKRIVGARPDPRGGKAARRVLTREDLLRLKLWYNVGANLPAAHRQRLFAEIEASPGANTVRADDLLIVDIAEARRQVDARLQDLDEAERAVHRVKDIMGGEPVFKGTRIPVHLVASMLAQGAEAAEILEGYPALTPRMLRLAEIWAAAHPTRGRPRKLSDQGFPVKSVKQVPLKGAPRPWSRSDG